MTNILITNGYSWYNKGDAGIILGTIKTLDQVFDDPEYTILSFTPEVDQQSYPIDAEFLNDPLGIEYNSHRFNKYLVPVRGVMAALSAGTNRSPKNPTLQAYAEADIVISCGGGYLGGHSLVSLTHVFAIWLAKVYEKDYYIFAQSINKIENPVLKPPTKHVLDHAKHIFPRESISEEYLHQMGVEAPITRIPDAAFMLEPGAERSVSKEVSEDFDSRTIFGVTAREWSFPEYNDTEEQVEKYITSFSDTIDRLVENHDAEVVFLPQVIFEPHDDDREISHRIASRCDRREHVYVLTGDYTPRELIALAGSCDLFLGTRMHSNIFSLISGTPTAAISYQPKTDGIMKMAGVGDYTVDIGNLTPEKLYGLAEELIENRTEVSTTIDSRIAELRGELHEVAKSLAEPHDDSSETRSLN